jgi:hypothetical protein
LTEGHSGKSLSIGKNYFNDINKTILLFLQEFLLIPYFDVNGLKLKQVFRFTLARP